MAVATALVSTLVLRAAVSLSNSVCTVTCRRGGNSDLQNDDNIQCCRRNRAPLKTFFNRSDVRTDSKKRKNYFSNEPLQLKKHDSIRRH